MERILDREKRIKIEDLKDRWLYQVRARSFQIAVWDAKEQHFVGIRTKFGNRYLDSENHWDAKEFASCCPMQEICELPPEIPNGDQGHYGDKALFAWLISKEKELGINTEED